MKKIQKVGIYAKHLFITVAKEAAVTALLAIMFGWAMLWFIWDILLETPQPLSWWQYPLYAFLFAIGLPKYDAGSPSEKAKEEIEQKSKPYGL